MTDTERYVNETCERIVASGHVRLYRDLYKDLRERLPCAAACRLIADGLRLTRHSYARAASPDWSLTGVRRARAIAALSGLERYAQAREVANLIEEYNGLQRRPSWKSGPGVARVVPPLREAPGDAGPPQPVAG